ncbi:hypothetical protein [Microbacterium sp. VKM Ac-2923]|uniref:hypothetical protein n=1 Tax=Microbacterium sp. VKM Ac-2923 TaxID=2929476 RepID=UPI001FB1B0B9|nr:hypothetical protein [Microbacterium sp. VKM Ac-2923]MCJ1706904.1 hypothetical protein [Microbacterium sp. VKM Ac-2923]
MDFWGAIFPNYIAALGGFAATVLAVVSLIRADQARARTAQTALSEMQTRQVVQGTLEQLVAASGVNRAYEQRERADEERLAREKEEAARMSRTAYQRLLEELREATRDPAADPRYVPFPTKAERDS